MSQTTKNTNDATTQDRSRFFDQMLTPIPKVSHPEFYARGQSFMGS